MGQETDYASDSLGRDTLVTHLGEAPTATSYDVLDRVVRSVTFSGTDSLVVTHAYELGNTPFFAGGVSYRDVVETKPKRRGTCSAEWCDRPATAHFA
jgi:hypothetical protein